MQEKESVMVVRCELKISFIRNNCSASLGKPHDAKQLQNFQSTPHNHLRFLYSCHEFDFVFYIFSGEKTGEKDEQESIYCREIKTGQRSDKLE